MAIIIIIIIIVKCLAQDSNGQRTRASPRPGSETNEDTTRHHRQRDSTDKRGKHQPRPRHPLRTNGQTRGATSATAARVAAAASPSLAMSACVQAHQKSRRM